MKKQKACKTVGVVSPALLEVIRKKARRREIEALDAKINGIINKLVVREFIDSYNQRAEILQKTIEDPVFASVVWEAIYADLNISGKDRFRVYSINWRDGTVTTGESPTKDGEPVNVVSPGSKRKDN